jgi:anionic cell wall polymer biosynthesis LytR-Cps2A-Psr (LCP) family protein
MLERRSRRTDRGAVLLALIAVVVLATAAYAWVALRVDRITESLRRRQPLNLLFVLSEGDSMLAAEAFLYNPETRKATLYHVPPNLGGVIPSLNRVDGIDALYRRSAPEALIARVGEVLGTTMHGWVDIDAVDLGRMADLLGGLALFIPTPVDATWNGRRVLLPSGSVRLDGDKTRDYLAWEDPLETDAERAGRRQKLVQALLAALGENRVLLAERAPARFFAGLVHTNLPRRALAALVAELGRFDAGRMGMQRVLGNVRSVDGRDLLFPHQEGELVKEAVQKSLAANASSQQAGVEDTSVTVEVLNGTATPGLAARAREVFLSYDLDVPQPRNADNDGYEYTLVIDRAGALETARRVAEIINCTRVQSRPGEGTDRGVDVTVILGRDFDGRTCTQQP